ncbi:MAG: UDP-N-acetylmuramate dehydrogenase [Paludibacteraceae bacterium]|nr:UDP-N-acetylmuramate dehydrogenase [Paludibacteraceae bacterium]
MTIKENSSLLPYNTFGLPAKAKVFAEYSSVEELKELLTRFRGEKILHIGQGSNLLFTGDFDGVILHSGMAKARFLDDETVEAQSGLRLDDLIAQLTDMGYCGMEKLSLIPGEVGASAVQNVGAYGVEAKDVILSVKTLDVETLEERVFTNEECRFSYRDSAFKHELKGRYIVTSVVYHVTKGDATQTRQEIIDTRNAKLPKVGEVGSAGSFFMNPFVSEEKAAELLKQYPDMPHYPVGAPSVNQRSVCDGESGGTSCPVDIAERYQHHNLVAERVKIPAAWLIDQCGWKGKTHGGAQVWSKQPLVLVNAHNASAQDIIELAEAIRQSVLERFGIDIHPEVNYI